MKKILLPLFLMFSLLFQGCDDNEGDDFTPYIKLTKVYQESGGSKVFADMNYGYIDCAQSPEAGIVWSTSANPTIANNKVVFTSQCFSQSGGNVQLTNLPSKTMIYVKAYSKTKDSSGIVYSNEMTFTTN